MKPSLIAILFLVLILPVAVPAKESAPDPPKPNVICSMPYWQPDSIVNVHFLRGMFTLDQQQRLLEAMRHSEETARRMGLAVTFKFAGETDGLIDCQSCLTVARQDVYKNRRKGAITLNPVRQNNLGQLISAWIEVDRAPNSSAGLRGLMLEALREVRGTKALSACKR